MAHGHSSHSRIIWTVAALLLALLAGDATAYRNCSQIHNSTLTQHNCTLSHNSTLTQENSPQAYNSTFPHMNDTRSHSSNVAHGNCNGIHNYGLTIYMRWTMVTDKAIPRNASVPHVVVVSHTSEWKLYESTQKLAPYVKTFVQEQKLGPLLSQLDYYRQQGVVEGYDYMTRVGPTDTLRMGLRLNGDTGATKISIIGLLHPTPDWFFGASAIEMCTGTKFADRYPPSKDVKVLWMQSLDAGLDDRDSILEIPKPVDEIVTVDGRIDLGDGYAQFELEKVHSTEAVERVPFWQAVAEKVRRWWEGLGRLWGV